MKKIARFIKFGLITSKKKRSRSPSLSDLSCVFWLGTEQGLGHHLAAGQLASARASDLSICAWG